MIRIFQIDRGYSLWTWLCPKHLELRKSQGWEVKEAKDGPPWLTCDLRKGLGPCGEAKQRKAA